jgi:predicted transcriptional regulator
MEIMQETMQEYVVRKLNERTINLVALSESLNMNRSKIYRIKNGGETSASTLQKLNDYFRKAGE